MLHTEVQKVWRKFFTFRSNIYQPCLLFCIGREGVGGWLNLIYIDQQYVKCIIRIGGGGWPEGPIYMPSAEGARL